MGTRLKQKISKKFTKNMGRNKKNSREEKGLRTVIRIVRTGK